MLNFLYDIEDDVELNISRIISQAIKRERLEKNLTLESMAHGICSLSYLSKIENFTIIPHTSYLEALCERLDIDFKRILESQIKNDINEVLKFYLYQLYDNLEEVYWALDNPYYNVSDGFIKIIYHLYKENFSEVEKEIKYVNDVKNTLTAKEVNILTLLVTEYYLKTNQFKKIEEKLDLLINLSKNASEFQSLYFEQLFIAAYHLDINHLLYRYYHLLHDNKLIVYPTCRLYKIHIMMLEVQSREKNCNSLEKLSVIRLNNSMMEIDDDLNYYQSLIYLNKKMYQEAYEQLANKKNHSPREIAILLYAAYKGEILDNDQLLLLAENIEYKSYEHAHKNFINFIIFKIKGIKRIELAEMIKYHMLPSNNLSPFPIYSRIYLKELFKLGFRNSYYRLIDKYFH